MPKRPAGLPDGRMQWRDTFVTRMTEHQDARGWSDAGLAERISRHYPMSAATVWKLKNATPPRGVSIDEALAIVSAFGFTSLDSFLATSTAAGVASAAMGAAREKIIVYSQSSPYMDVLPALEKIVSHTLAGSELQLTDNQVADLEAGVELLRQSLTQWAESANWQVAQLGRKADAIRDAVHASRGER